MRRMRDEALPESMKRFPVWAHPHRAVVRVTYRTEAFVAATTYWASYTVTEVPRSVTCSSLDDYYALTGSSPHESGADVLDGSP